MSENKNLSTDQIYTYLQAGQTEIQNIQDKIYNYDLENYLTLFDDVRGDVYNVPIHCFRKNNYFTNSINYHDFQEWYYEKIIKLLQEKYPEIIFEYNKNQYPSRIELFYEFDPEYTLVKLLELDIFNKKYYIKFNMYSVLDYYFRSLKRKQNSIKGYQEDIEKINNHLDNVKAYSGLTDKLHIIFQTKTYREVKEIQLDRINDFKKWIKENEKIIQELEHQIEIISRFEYVFNEILKNICGYFYGLNYMCQEETYYFNGISKKKDTIIKDGVNYE